MSRDELPTTKTDTDDSREETEPLSGLAADASERRTRSSEFDELFDRKTGPDLDDERVWEQLESDGVEPIPGEGEADHEPEHDPDQGPDPDREYREISKRGYCHQCEHFASPPAVACQLAGTEILEMPTLETFRVADCPVVLEDEALERQR